MMEAVFIRLFNMSVAAGWMILAVAALRLLLRDAPKSMRCLLWGLVGIRLACPFTVKSMLSLIPSAETLPPGILYSPAPAIHSGVAALNSAVNPMISESLAPQAGASVNPVQILVYIASRVWAAGVLLMLIYAAVSFFRLKGRVAASVSAGGNIMLCDDIGEPFILGFFRPRIYLPAAMEEDIAAHVKAHEQAHLERRDHWWKPIGFLLLSVHWFNPLVWMGYILLCRDIELACDERVIKGMGADGKLSYSEALLRCSSPRRMITACPVAFGEAGVRGRIKSVLSYKKPAFWVFAAAAAACVIAAVCFLTDPEEPAAPTQSPFGQSYRVSGVLYDAPQFSFSYTPETAPRYSVSGDGILFSADDILTGEGAVGELRETELTAASFDALFVDIDGVSGWTGGADIAAELRKENHRSWVAVSDRETGDILYYLLQQKNGDIYLTYGYRGGEKEAPEAGLIRWLFLLEPHQPERTGAPSPGIYVSERCLYMNPLSSYAAIGGDSGLRYVIEEGSFTMLDRVSGAVMSIAVSDWGWRSFPYSDLQWEAMYVPGGFGAVKDINGRYGELLYQPLMESYGLIKADSELWLVELRENPQMGSFIWSIYTIVPEIAKGAARWQFLPYLSSQYPAFYIEFDFPFQRLSAACAEGKLIPADKNGEPRGRADNAVMLQSGEALYWQPTLEGSSPQTVQEAGRAEIHFTVQSGSSPAAGTIYIELTEGQPGPGASYTATVVGGGLHMSQHPGRPGAVVHYAVSDGAQQTLTALSKESAAAFIDETLSTLTVHDGNTASFELPPSIPADPEGKTRLMISMSSTNVIEAGSYSVKRLLDDETQWSGGQRYAGDLSNEGRLQRVFLRVAFMTELSPGLFREYLAGYVELTAPFEYGVKAGKGRARTAFALDGQHLTVDYAAPNTRSMSVSMTLPQGVGVSPAEDEYPAEAYPSPPELAITMDGRAVGALLLIGYGASDERTLATVDTSSPQLPMQIYSPIALSNMMDFGSGYRVVKSTGTMGAAVCRPARDGETVSDCVVAFDLESEPYFLMISLQPGVLDDVSLSDLAASIEFSSKS